VGATLPRLRSGDNDLGVFRLRTTGAIRGAVRDEGGLPLENARVDLPDAETPLRVRSDVRGEYFLAHVPPGPHEISAEHDRHASALARCEVEPRLVTDGVDFVLRVASTLSGFVVDERGRGLAGATVRASPVQGGALARAESEADGRFTILLKEVKPHTLSASLEGFLPFGELDSRRHAPGTDDLRIVLQRSADVLTRFVVVDAASRAPVERFGIEIGYDGVSASRSGWRKDARPEPVEHRNGEVELPARPGQDVYTVVAPGYLRNKDEVRHESPESRRQVVELLRGGAIVGRVVDAGSPAAEVGVRLVPGRLVSGGPTTSRFAENGTVQTTRTDAQGRFRFDALEPGTFRVLARGADGFVERVPVELGLAGDQDLGDLELLAWATILGRVLVPPRRSAGGLEVELQDPLAPEKTTTDAEGRFRFGELTAGEHRLVVREVPRELAHGASATVTLAAGEAKEVEIDARDRGTCDVELRIELPGRTAEGLRVSLYPVVPGDGIVLGTTDAGGRVAGWAPAWGEARVEIATEGLTLRHPTARLLLELDRDVEATVRFDVGGFVLELPGASPWPNRGWGRLKLVPEGADGEAGAVAMVFRSDVAAGGATTVDGDHRLRCDLAPAGRFQATLEVQDLDAQPKPAVVYSTTFALEIRGGSVAEFRLP